MEMRTSKPSNNKYYIRQVNGGFNGAIQGNPTDASANVLANCVGYANGRFNEIIGQSKCVYQLVCNAENFIEKAQAQGLQISQIPTPGAIMVWQKGELGSSDGPGHVAIVERVNSYESVYTSESAYGGSAFYNQTRTKGAGNWGANGKYTFRGFIVNPAVKPEPEPEPEPEPTKSIEEIVNEVEAGKWGNGQERKDRLTEAGYDYNVIQDEVNRRDAERNKPAPETETVDENARLVELVRKTIRGDFGNGASRKTALGADYDFVQNQVNKNINNGTTHWDRVKLY